MPQLKPVQRLQSNAFLTKFHPQPGIRKEVNTVSPPPPPTPAVPAKKPMKWGEPTWFLFHTIAEKIKAEYFNEYKNEIFEIIKTICNTLPCPTCANHATEYMKKIYFQNIRSKEDLQAMLWAFHNEVNTRKGFALFPFENVNTKYSTANTRNIIQHFIQHHQDKHASFRMIADDLTRKRVCANLRLWFIRHMHIFDE
jgi:hypothetical protein